MEKKAESDTPKTDPSYEDLDKIAISFPEKKALCNRVIPLCLTGYALQLQPSENPFTQKNQVFTDLKRMRNTHLLLLFNGSPISDEGIKQFHRFDEALSDHPSTEKIRLESKLAGTRLRIQNLKQKSDRVDELKKAQLAEKDLVKQIAEIARKAPSQTQFIEECMEQDKYLFAELKKKLTPLETNQDINSTQLVKLFFIWHNQQIISSNGRILQAYAAMFDKDQNNMPVVQDMCLSNIESSSTGITFTTVTEKFSYTVFTEDSKKTRSDIQIDPIITTRFDITPDTKAALPSVYTDKIELVKHIFITFCENRCRALETTLKDAKDAKSPPSFLQKFITFFKPQQTPTTRFLYDVYSEMITTLVMDDTVFEKHMQQMAKLPCSDSRVDCYLAAQYIKKHSTSKYKDLMKQYDECVECYFKLNSEHFNTPKPKDAKSKTHNEPPLKRQQDIENTLKEMIQKISSIEAYKFKDGYLENLSVDALFLIYTDYLTNYPKILHQTLDQIESLETEITQLKKLGKFIPIS
ncbi:MAG TPA: hypothetical protein VHE99_11150 [Gammaproteobacteria bacterium]|nr:hypothetical protein [Gammaproteobacteria bacterium]